MIKYVCGFLFIGEEYVVLIQKKRPEWQRSKFNGPGGKIKEGENEYDAMRREFHEEAGVLLDEDEWIKFAVLSDNEKYHVSFFYAHRDRDPEDIRTQTDEKVEFFKLNDLPNFCMVPNCQWLIPMALSMKNYHFIHKIEEIIGD